MDTGRKLRNNLCWIARLCVVAAVVVSPWLFGSAEPWAFLSMCLLVGLGVAAWLLSLISDPHAGIRAPWLTLALAALLAFALFQMLPLSFPVVKAVSPVAAEAQAARAGLFADMEMSDFLPAGAKDDGRSAATSASIAATQRSFYLLAAYVGAFLVLANTVTEWRQLRRAATVIVASGFMMVVIGLLQRFSGTRAIYWFHVPRYGGEIFGSFTNRNHYAAYMNMAFGVALGLLLTAMRSARSGRAGTRREKLAWLSSRKGNRAVLLAFAAVLMAAAVCCTLSRGGIVSLVAALGVVGIFGAARGAVRGGYRMGVALVVLGVAGVVWLGWQPVAERLGTLVDVVKDPLSNSRTVAARDTLHIFRSSPVFGCGLGSFQHVFPRFQSPSIQIGRWLHAHNDYAQLLAEAGVVGASLVVLAVVAFLSTITGRFAKASRQARLLVGGVSVGLVAICLHSLVDFSLHKPANAFLLAALCGMCVSAVHLRPKRKTRKNARELKGTSAEQAVSEAVSL
ncbi:MAG: O-antigen ligase family protein [Candidatus Brocadiae bacterium]|nr:O-antigen ligase family protein [Candidatus Brocadiia bacterium]